MKIDSSIEMSPEEAGERLDSYLYGLRRRRLKRTDEIERVIAGYRSLCLGWPLIDLNRAMGASGWDDRGRPAMAVARADRSHVTFVVSVIEKAVTFNTADQRFWSSSPFPNLERKVPIDCYPKRKLEWATRRSGRAPVPLIPPDVVPRGAGSVRNLYVLWEVEDWDDVPVDPFLLKPVAPPLYAIVAQWDLTEVERAVLRGRLRG